MKRFFSISGTYKNRLDSKLKLNQFFKFTHPDFFHGYVDTVIETNNSNTSNLNEYLNNVKRVGN